MTNRAVGIVGCGTAGQASAILLSRAGWTVTIFDRAPLLQSIGAGLLIQPSGMAVLSQLGLLDHIRALASPVDRLLGTSKRDRPVMDVRYADLGPGIHGLGVHRGMLFGTLQQAVHDEGVAVRTGVTIREIERSGRQTEIVDCEDIVYGPFDLVLVCDGAASALRARSNLVERDRPYTWAALWFIGRAESDSDQTLRQVFGDTRQLLGLLPTGRLTAQEPALVSLFWSLRSDTIEDVMRAGVDAFKDSVHKLTTLADSLIDQIDSMDQLIVARYRDVVMRSCFDPPVGYLGDAAHAMSPQLGQGANLALVDAAALADSLQRGDNIAQGLATYAGLRARQTRFYQRASRHLMPFFQSDHQWLAVPRDMLMPHLCTWRWSRTKAAQTLAGLSIDIGHSNPIPPTSAD